MEERTQEQLRNACDWFARKADTTYARWWLAVFSFTESSIFIILPDPLLAAMVFVQKERWIRYAVITSAASIAGAVFGYFIGAVLFEVVGARIVEMYGLQEYMDTTAKLMRDNVFIFTLTAAFTPIPFKAVVFTAGFTKANFILFFIATVLGRSARYFFVAFVAKVLGENSDHLIKRFWFYSMGVGILIFAIFIAYSLLN